MSASQRKVPDLDTLLKLRADGLTDNDIAKLHNTTRSNVSRHFRKAGHGSGRGSTQRVLPDIHQVLEEYTREGSRVVADRYGVTVSAVRNHISRGRKNGTLPAYDPDLRPKKETAPRKSRAKAPSEKKPRVKKAQPKPAPRPVLASAPLIPAYVEPDLTGLCGARELLGTRVCDKHPHSPRTAHEGAGPKDERAEFWSARKAAA